MDGHGTVAVRDVRSEAHARLDRSVWAAYGWDDPDPAHVDDETILTRLRALNEERAGAKTT